MTDGVADHYSSAGLTHRIREALAVAGLGLADLDTGALAGVDCAALQRAGFSGIRETPRLQLVRDTMAAVRAGPSPPVDLGHLKGPDLPTMFANLLPLLGTTLAPIQLIARR